MIEGNDFSTGRTRLTLPEQPEKLPANIFMRMRAAFGYGRAHAHRVIVKNESHLTFGHPENSLVSLMAKMNGSLARRAISVAYWFGASQFADEILIKNEVGFREWWGAVFQRECVSLILALPADSTFEIRKVHEQLGVEPSAWLSNLSGAMACARTAYYLIRRRFEVYLPSIEEDVYGKIDLIAKRSDCLEGICLQVKGGNFKDTFTCTLVDAPRTPYERKFALGVAKFQSRVGGKWLPCSVFVGRVEGAVIELRNAPKFWRVIDEFIQKHMSDYDPYRASSA